MATEQCLSLIIFIIYMVHVCAERLLFLAFICTQNKTFLALVVEFILCGCVCACVFIYNGNLFVENLQILTNNNFSMQGD